MYVRSIHGVAMIEKHHHLVETSKTYKHQSKIRLFIGITNLSPWFITTCSVFSYLCPMRTQLLNILCLFMLTGCTKDEFVSYMEGENRGDTEYNDLTVEAPKDTTPVLNLFNKWVIVGGDMMIVDLETNDTTYHDHFTNSDSSSLRFGGSMFEIESIALGTTWEWVQRGGYGMNHRFIIDDDTADAYAFNITISNYWTIIEHPESTLNGIPSLKMGGSARPITGVTLDYYQGLASIGLQMHYFSHNNRNYTAFNRITIQLVGGTSRSGQVVSGADPPTAPLPSITK